MGRVMDGSGAAEARTKGAWPIEVKIQDRKALLVFVAAFRKKARLPYRSGSEKPFFRCQRFDRGEVIKRFFYFSLSP